MMANEGDEIEGEEGACVLVIYLPNRESMEVRVHPEVTVDGLIRKILRSHQSKSLDPPLLYSSPEAYEIRFF